MQVTFERVHGNDEVYLDCLRAICGDTEGKSMVDIGCNLAPHTSKLGFKKRKYIDILDRVLDNPKEQRYFVKANALDYLELNEKWYDVSMSLDNIEHLSYNDGHRLIKLMLCNSSKQVFFTPLNPWMMTDDNDLNPESHRSVWTPDLMPPMFASIVFPVYHPTLNIGAWFGWNCKDTKQDFERVKNELKQKAWAKDKIVLTL